jgi:putative transposase
MPRSKRYCPAGMVFHCLNRSVAQMTLFEKEGDYEAFESIILEALERVPIRILEYTIMPNRWHFVVWPETHMQTSDFFYYLTSIHAARWHSHHGTWGTGHLYQGRFKSFPVQEDDHLLSVLRYVQRNPRRAGLVSEAELWKWGSAWRRHSLEHDFLSDWPVRIPSEWREHVNRPQTEAELAALRGCVQKGTPFGDREWVRSTAARLGLKNTLRSR